jgi:heme exporter protein D
LREFFAMGGYAAFLWPAYAVTFLALAWNIVAARRALATAIADARRRASAGDEGEPS